ILIDALVRMGVEVHLASSGSAATLLQQVFPKLPFLSLPPYKITYSKGAAQVLHLLGQVPSVLRTIHLEHKTIHQYIEKNKFSGIISDHRYGIWDERIPSVFIGHQLALMLPRRLRLFRGTVYDYHLHWLRFFDQIWIPDVEGEKSLSGGLTHDFPLPTQASFIGPLSRFMMEDIGKKNVGIDELDVLAILSGPEPQRSLLEDKLREELQKVPGKKWLIQGKPAMTHTEEVGSLTVHAHLPAAMFREALKRANVIISRSGY
ncbi:MAG: hypothetical protein AAFR59_06385, partial [Bacteroidota bacterium]